MNRILILPYQSSQATLDTAYISEGILEELIQALTSSKDLKICSRSTSLYLSKNHLSPIELLKQHQIDFVLEGFLKIEGEELIISSRVFSTKTDDLLLNTKFTTPLNFWTQSIRKLANDIISVTNSKAFYPSKYISTTQAKEYYLKGLYHWHRYTYDEMLLAIQAYKKSIKEDANFALAYAGIADCYSIIGIMGFSEPKEAFKQANTFLFKSLELDNTRSDTYVSAAFINIFSEYDFPKAKLNLEKALTLNTKSVKVHHTYAMYYIHLAEFNLAEKHSAITIKQEPLAIPHYAMMIRILFYKRQFKAAKTVIDQALLLDSESHILIEYCGFYYLFTGQIELAIDHFKLSLAYYANNPMALAHLAYAYSKVSFYEESRAVERQIKHMATDQNKGIIAYALALVKLGYHDYDAFFEHANLAVNLGVGVFPADLKCNPLFTEVQQDKRYSIIMDRCRMLDNSSIQLKERRPIARCEIQTNTSEIFKCDPQDILFIKANDNYSVIYWYDNGILRNNMLRISLKRLEEQFNPFNYLYRCHKSFIINLLHPIAVIGNKRETWVESKALPIRIPVSRSKTIFLKEALKMIKRPSAAQ